jgi:hypothetical protein
MSGKNLVLTAIRSAHLQVHEPYLAPTAPDTFTNKQVRSSVRQTSKHQLCNSKNSGSSGSCVLRRGVRFWGRDQRPQFSPPDPHPLPSSLGPAPEIGLHGGLREGDGPGEVAIACLLGSGPDTGSVRKNRMSREGAYLRPWLRSGCWCPAPRFPTDLGGLFHLTRSRGVTTRSPTEARLFCQLMLHRLRDAV